MPRYGGRVGAAANVHDMWSCGLLRLVEEQTRNEALSPHQPPDRSLGWARRVVGLVLRR
jgi:hypothetical protein